MIFIDFLSLGSRPGGRTAWATAMNAGEALHHGIVKRFTEVVKT
jgi:hypothetical protein